MEHAKPNLLETAATICLTACALIMTALVARRELWPRSSAPQRTSAVRDWRSYVGGNERIGPADAPVTIVEFSDFQCPFCRRFALVVDSVEARHPNDVQVVFRNFPIAAIHPFARPAALACTDTFGDMYNPPGGDGPCGCLAAGYCFRYYDGVSGHYFDREGQEVDVECNLPGGG